MPFRTLKPIGLAAVPMALLAGCTTAQYAPRYSYYRVPCTVPGAIPAQPIGVEADPASPSAQPTRSGAPADPATAEPTCVVAVSDASYSRGYSPYYPGGYYGRPYYGSVGVGFGLGATGHHGFGGRHFRGSHFGGGHGGGHGGHH